MFKKLDKLLYNMFDAPEQHCDGCGESVATYLLTNIPMWDGDFCKRCVIYESPEEELFEDEA
jgi:hypothetical protein